MPSLTGRDSRASAKAIKYMEMYGASEIMIGRRTGHYPPLRDINYADLELRVLAFYNK